MTIEEVMRARLMADTDLGPLIGDRIAPDVAPGKAQFPFLLYQRLSAQEEYDIEGAPFMEIARIQYSSLGETWIAARRLSDAVRSVALGVRGTFDGIVIDSVYVADQRDQGYDEIAGSYRWDLDLEIYRTQIQT